MSEKQTSQLRAIPRVSLRFVNAPPGLCGIWRCAALCEHRFLQSKNVARAQKQGVGVGGFLLGSSYFCHWEYPRFYSLALPDANPEGISLAQVGKHVAPARSLCWGLLITMVELWDLNWGKASPFSFTSFCFYCLSVEKHHLAPVSLSLFECLDLHPACPLVLWGRKAFGHSTDTERKSSGPEQHVFQFALLKPPLPQGV